MTSGPIRFGEFDLDPENRRLSRNGQAVALNARYLDALILMAAQPGRLVTKDEFLAEVWRGVPVTDEALTQCIRTLRRTLDDDAGRPRFIETVPKHGYRFIAPPETEVPTTLPDSADPPRAGISDGDGRWATTAVAAGLGGGLAGAVGGLIYGLMLSGQTAPDPGLGAASTLSVLALVTLIVGTVGAGAVGLGIALARRITGRLDAWVIAGAAGGGLAIGALARLLGLDAFTLLLGRSPGDMTGAYEGLVLGAGVGLAFWIGARRASLRRRDLALAGLIGAGAGILITLTGGRLMAGSLDHLARAFPDSLLRLDRLGLIFAEEGLGQTTALVTSAFEGGLFTLCTVAALRLADRRPRSARPEP